MATKDEITGAIRANQERVERLAPRLAAGLGKPLPAGTWTVHDAICHLAADSNAVPAFVQRIQRAVQGEPRRASSFDVDAYNEAQIALRKAKPLEQVLAELQEGFRADIERVEKLDEVFLQQELPDVRGQVHAVSDQMRGYIGGHPSRHLDDIEAALKG